MFGNYQNKENKYSLKNRFNQGHIKDMDKSNNILHLKYNNLEYNLYSYLHHYKSYKPNHMLHIDLLTHHYRTKLGSLINKYFNRENILSYIQNNYQMSDHIECRRYHNFSISSHFYIDFDSNFANIILYPNYREYRLLYGFSNMKDSLLIDYIICMAANILPTILE